MADETRLRKNTGNLRQDAIRASSASWVISPDTVYEDNKGNECFYIDPVIHRQNAISELPTEFFSRELKDVNIDDLDNLTAFIRSWGLPFHPYRFRVYSPGGMATERIQNAIEETATLSRSKMGNSALAVSLSEARLTISTLQECVNGMFSMIRGESGKVDLTPIMAGSVNPIRLISTGSRDVGFPIVDACKENAYIPYLSLTNAICNQIVATFADPAEWGICACTEEKERDLRACGRIFKRQRNENGRSPSSESAYCSPQCRDRQKKRRRTRIDHGL